MSSKCYEDSVNTGPDRGWRRAWHRTTAGHRAEWMRNAAAGEKSAALANAQQSWVTGCDCGSGTAPWGLPSCPPVPRSDSRCLWPGFPRASEQAAIGEARLQHWSEPLQDLKPAAPGHGWHTTRHQPWQVGGPSTDQCGSESLIPLVRAIPSRHCSLGWLVPPAQPQSLPASHLETQLWPS